MAINNQEDTGIQNRDREQRTWTIEQIFLHSDDGHYVPNPGDFVIDEDQGILIVRDVDYETGRSRLELWMSSNKSSGETDDDNILLATGPGTPYESYMCLIDKTVTPYALTINNRLYFRGSMVNYVKVFLGSDINEDTGKVIAFIKDSAGNRLSENIPLEEITVPGATTQTVKIAQTAYTEEDLLDSEKVTVAAYSDEGHVISTDQLVVKNTGMARRLESSNRYVSGISIESPFVSGSDPTTIEFPVNASVESLPMQGIVNYSDGGKLRLPIDGNRMDLFGKEDYLASVPGQEFGFTLVYQLQGNEVAYNDTVTGNNRITRAYRGKTMAAEGAYSNKLYVYPNWNKNTNRYELVFWLYNLDRNTRYNVTDVAELGSNSMSFNPTSYGMTQTLTYAVDLSKVDSKFTAYRHVQTFQILLRTQGTSNDDNWTLLLKPDQDDDYGELVAANMRQGSTNAWTVNLVCGEDSQEKWVNKLFYKLEPLYNPQTEARAPYPTHFRIVTKQNKYEKKITQWDEDHQIVNDLDQGELLYIEWIYRSDDDDLQLAISGLPVHILSQQD